jgi:hypothetical protein
LSETYITARQAHRQFPDKIVEGELKEHAMSQTGKRAFLLLQTLLEYHSDNALLKNNAAIYAERLGLERAISILKRIRGEQL